MSFNTLNKNYLLRACRCQEIDYFFYNEGYTRTYIYNKIIYPNFLISRRTYESYLTLNAKSLLREKYNIDWYETLNKIGPPIDYEAYKKQILNLKNLQLSIFPKEEWERNKIR